MQTARKKMSANPLQANTQAYICLQSLACFCPRPRFQAVLMFLSRLSFQSFRRSLRQQGKILVVSG